MDLTPSAFVRRIGSVIGSLRRQAPGARMVGEFAVKHATNEVKRRVTPPRSPEP